MKKNSQIVVRISKETIEQYNKFCDKHNSLMSIRIRKFIELELKYGLKNKNLLEEIEKNAK